MVRIRRRSWMRQIEPSVIAIGLIFSACTMAGGALFAQVSLPAVNATQPAQPSAAAPSIDQAKAQSQMRAATLRLDSGDLLEVTTFDTPELSGEFRVDGRGEVSLPLGGAVRVQGLTAEQTAVAVERFLRDRDILKNPHVTVLVLEYATQGVNVMGEVKQPGIYPLTGKHGVLDFISMAGGLTAFASNAVSITHNVPPWDITTVNLAGSHGNTLENDVEVQPGDRIVVLRAGVVYVIGDVGKPGGFVLEGKDSVTVLQALALAQGMNRTAKSNGFLIRTDSGKRTETQLALNKILVNQSPDPKLQDGDIVFVPLSSAKDWTNKGVASALQMAVGAVIYGRL